MNEIVYFKKYRALRPLPYYKPLNPTGRWKIVSDIHNNTTIFVEHKDRIFKQWISEDRILFGTEENTEVFCCDGGSK